MPYRNRSWGPRRLPDCSRLRPFRSTPGVTLPRRPCRRHLTVATARSQGARSILRTTHGARLHVAIRSVHNKIPIMSNVNQPAPPHQPRRPRQNLTFARSPAGDAGGPRPPAPGQPSPRGAENVYAGGHTIPRRVTQNAKSPLPLPPVYRGPGHAAANPLMCPPARRTRTSSRQGETCCLRRHQHRMTMLSSVRSSSSPYDIPPLLHPCDGRESCSHATFPPTGKGKGPGDEYQIRRTTRASIAKFRPANHATAHATPPAWLSPAHACPAARRVGFPRSRTSA